MPTTPEAGQAERLDQLRELTPRASVRRSLQGDGGPGQYPVTVTGIDRLDRAHGVLGVATQHLRRRAGRALPGLAQVVDLDVGRDHVAHGDSAAAWNSMPSTPPLIVPKLFPT